MLKLKKYFMIMNFKTRKKSVGLFSLLYRIVCSKFAKLFVESMFILWHAVLCERLYQRGGWHFKIALPLGFTNVLDKAFFFLAVEKLYHWRWQQL